ncbi:MAG: ribosome recycling factor [Saprospiraceae bacterium]
MQDDIQAAIDKASSQMDQAIDHLEKELQRLRTGKASPSLVSGIMVDYYGSPTPMSQVANISTVDSRSISIQPWEKTLVPAIEKAIFESNIGLTPQSDGESVRINIPPLTGERRVELAKQAKALGEDAKVSIRNARRDANNLISREVKEGFPEDQAKGKEKLVQDLTDKHSKKVEETVVAKEKDIMTI